MLFVTNLCETALLLKSVKPILYLGNVLLLRYVLIYNLVNLEVSFNFHLTFLQLTGTKTLNTFNLHISVARRTKRFTFFFLRLSTD